MSLLLLISMVSDKKKWWVAGELFCVITNKKNKGIKQPIQLFSLFFIILKEEV